MRKAAVLRGGLTAVPPYQLAICCMRLNHFMHIPDTFAWEVERAEALSQKQTRAPFPIHAETDASSAGEKCYSTSSTDR